MADEKKGQELMDNVFGSSWNLAPEEVRKRERRARTAAAIGNLGNVMGAFANLYYAGKGAPAMKVPDPVVPDYMNFEDKVNAARKEAKVADIAMKQKASELEERKAYHDAVAKSREENPDVTAAKVNAYNALAEQRRSTVDWNLSRIALNEAQKAFKDGNLQLGYAKLEEAKRYHDGMLGIRAAGTTTTETKSTPLGTETTTKTTKPNVSTPSNGGSKKFSIRNKNQQSSQQKKFSIHR